MFADLHIHSTFSDGKYTPEQIVDAAAENNINVICITDHDSVNGIAKAVQYANKHKKSVRIITGAELGTQYLGKSVHILAYYIDPDNKELNDKMHEMRHAREIRLQKMIDKLNLLGYAVQVEACDPENRAVGRPHVAKALVRKGYFQSVQEVFDKLLKEGAPAFIPQPKLSPEEAVKLIHNAGGIAVLAHPGEIENKQLVNELLDKHCFDGIEVYHPSADEAAAEYWLHIARERKLLVSGGSDFHGLPDRFPAHLGIFNINTDLLSDIINYR